MKPALNPPAFSFARTYRLTTKADYSAVFDAGQKVSQGWFLALYKKNQQTHSRVGIIISKRIIKKATGRNTLKRLIRESFRIRKVALPGLDIVILARKGCRVEDKVKLQKELDTIWQRLSSV